MEVDQVGAEPPMQEKEADTREERKDE